MKRYRLVESDVATIDPNIEALYKVVEELEAKKPGSSEKFTKILQSKYGITSTGNLKKSMSMWIKIPVGGLSLAGFITSMGIAIDAAAKSDLVNNIDKIIPGDKVYVSIACVWLSFVFWKIFRYVIGSSNKTESTSNKSYSEQKAILETEIFVTKMNQFMESDVVDPVVKLNATAEKADGICRRMFNWIKGKVADGWDWVKKHPYITTAFLIVIGCVFYYINVLRGQISNLQGTVSGLQSTNISLSNKVAELSKQLALNIDSNKLRPYLVSEKEHVRKVLGVAADLKERSIGGEWSAGNELYNDIIKSLSNMNKDQFAAYFKCIYDTSINDNDWKDFRDMAKLALDKITDLMGNKTVNNLIDATRTVTFR